MSLIIGVLFFGLMLLPIIFDMFVFENIMRPLMWGGLVISLIMAGFLLKELYTPGSRVRLSVEARNGKIWFHTIAFVLGFPLLVIPTISKGIPIFLHFFSSHPAEIVVTVKRKDPNYNDRRCKGGFTVNEFSYFLNNEVCGISENDWRILKPGNRVFLVGNKSFFGFTYNKYKI